MKISTNDLIPLLIDSIKDHAEVNEDGNTLAIIDKFQRDFANIPMVYKETMWGFHDVGPDTVEVKEPVEGTPVKVKSKAST